MASVMIMAGCKKKEIQGSKGDAGTPGGGGNSSISNSDVFTIASTQWKQSSDSLRWEVIIPSSLVTEEVAAKGSVKVFVRYGTSWTELPNTRLDLFTQFSFQKGVVKLDYFDIHGSLPEKPVTSDYRIVTLYVSGKQIKDETNIFVLEQYEYKQ